MVFRRGSGMMELSVGLLEERNTREQVFFCGLPESFSISCQRSGHQGGAGEETYSLRVASELRMSF